MEQRYLHELAHIELFDGIDSGELGTLLACLQPKIKKYRKDETIYRAGDSISTLSIVLSGFVQIISEDIFGNRSILSGVGRLHLFGESFACAKAMLLPVSVVAAADSEVLMLDYRRVIGKCSSACIFHAKLIENMLEILANKNIYLNKKLNIMSKRSTREKVLAYLGEEAKKQESSVIKIEFNRQELADYLYVDRSALSAELSRMRNEGIIDFDRNRFVLYRHTDDDMMF